MTRQTALFHPAIGNMRRYNPPDSQSMETFLAASELGRHGRTTVSTTAPTRPHTNQTRTIISFTAPLAQHASTVHQDDATPTTPPSACEHRRRLLPSWRRGRLAGTSAIETALFPSVGCARRWTASGYQGGFGRFILTPRGGRGTGCRCRCVRFRPTAKLLSVSASMFKRL